MNSISKFSVQSYFAILTLAIFLFSAGNMISESDAEKNDLSIKAKSYLSYQTEINSGDLENGKFQIKRAYLTVKKSITKGLSFRTTLDAHQDDEGDMEVRLKYLYAHFKFDDFAFITKPNIEFGLVHGPWLDFEQNLNYYRMLGYMFMERSGLFNSADFGITVGGFFVGEMDKEYKSKVNKKYAGRYGSFAFGIYNGGGYHAIEETDNKVFEGRLTIRPLPDIIPGLQLSYLGIFGDGNHEYGLDSIPEWIVNTGMLSYEHELFTFTGQYVSGKGNQKGKYVVDTYKSASVGGFSTFAEIKPDENWRIIARYDNFDKNKDIDDNEEQRYILGVGYDFGKQNILILDFDKTLYENGDMDKNLMKLTMQLKF